MAKTLASGHGAVLKEEAQAVAEAVGRFPRASPFVGDIEQFFVTVRLEQGILTPIKIVSFSCTVYLWGSLFEGMIDYRVGVSKTIEDSAAMQSGDKQWIITDEPISGSQLLALPYRNHGLHLLVHTFFADWLALLIGGLSIVLGVLIFVIGVLPA
ncbi:hypothetical protein BDK51DRAFT_32160 [Blyttiomyces helicus]|uniref:Uncharacterized protein n=1 Tax=Blyttiomyces helicus TaxID=388810 RepID=A0A4P9W4V6_9FUNG|nr:hypothetical protein BDK51DRAFT_32160 [Blyttiomyces helicus]|eukprot:RKO85760.1 hypothetical protein BDK51DRAFT_32160 [Blyttiomyces helicus]